MASKNAKAAATDDELNKLFAGIEDATPGNVPSKGTATKPAASLQAEQDALADLENLVAQQPTERPHTPRILSSTAAGARSSPSKHTTGPLPPTVVSARSSEEKSGDSARSFHTSLTPSVTSSELQDPERKAPNAQPASAGGGWWGGLIATASAAVKTAEAAVKEIQQNEEAKRWAEQVKGNVGALRGFGMESKIHSRIMSNNIQVVN